MDNLNYFCFCLISATLVWDYPNMKGKKNMELNKTFKITFWAKKHKKHIQEMQSGQNFADTLHLKKVCLA